MDGAVAGKEDTSMVMGVSPEGLTLNHMTRSLSRSPESGGLNSSMSAQVGLAVWHVICFYFCEAYTRVEHHEALASFPRKLVADPRAPQKMRYLEAGQAALAETLLRARSW